MFAAALCAWRSRVDRSVRRTGRGEWWYLGQWPHTWVHDDTDLAVNISCKLVRRLSARMKRDGARGVLVALYGLLALSWSADHPDLGAIQQLIACARPSWRVVDTFESFKGLGARDPAALRGRYAQVHLSDEGARQVAALIELQIRAGTSSSADAERR